ncbi:MAG: hypothetical protein IIW75_02580 [Bacteroidaceae bacterium]|nr:hypothetical protein [Bacteroidaceae bacterium]
MERIKIQIFGNPIRHAGARLLLDSSAPFGLEYAGLPGISLSPYAIEIKVQPTYTFYKLVRNNVITSDGNQGTLVIGMSIPVDHKISMGKTPLDVLLDIWEKFKTTYMYPSLGAAAPDSYTYKPIDGLIAADLFQDVLNKYPLEKVYAPYYPMKGSGKCALSLNMMEMRDFTRDVCCYENLSKYESVVIAEKMDAIHYVENLTGHLEIPLRRRFKLDGKVYENVNETITISSNEDARCFERQTCSFTIAQLLSGNAPQGVMFDYRTDTITYNLKGAPKRIQYTVRILCNGAKVNDADCMGALTLTVKGRNVFLVGNTFTLDGEENISQISINFAHPKYRLVSCRELDLNERVLSVNVAENPQEKPQSAPAERKMLVKVKSYDPEENYWFKIEKENKYLYEGVLKFAATDKSKKDKVATIVLPEFIGTEAFYISIHTAKKTTEPHSYSYRATAPRDVEFDLAKMKPIGGSATLYNKLCLFFAPILLLATIFFGYLYFTAPEPVAPSTQKVQKKTEKKKETDTADKKDDATSSQAAEAEADVSKQAADNANNAASGSSQNSSNENVANPPASSTPPTKTPDQKVASALGNIAPENAELDKFLNKVKTELAKDGLTFAKVKELYKEYEKKFKNVQLTSDQKKIEALLKAYNEVVGVLSLTDKEKFKQEMKKLAPNHGAVKSLNKKHREWFLAIRWGDYRANSPKIYHDENVDKPQVDSSGRSLPGKTTTHHGAEGLLNFYITNKGKKDNNGKIKFTNFESLGAFWDKRNYAEGN